MTRQEELTAAIERRRAELAQQANSKLYEWEKYRPSEITKITDLANAIWNRRIQLNIGRPVRISAVMRAEMEEIFLYSGLNYKREALTRQYRELMEDNPERARDPHVVRWYVKKWRKIDWKWKRVQ